jgi:methionyl-tRNA formyltransferase
MFPVFIGNPREGRLLEFLKDKNCDLLLSINYLFLIGSDVISFPKFYAINFHGSLLPKYRGRTPHIWAIINGEKTCGITAHLIEEGCDTGPIVLQHEVEISPEDTGQMILEKYKQIYPNIVKQVIGKVRDNKLVFFEQDNSKATFFGKRTPNDGKINWSWQKSRINNWIRAQAGPYPGAFTFYKGEKIIVDKIDVTTIEFEPLLKNGTIIKVVDNIPYVKTPNGIVKLSKIRNQRATEIFRKQRAKMKNKVFIIAELSANHNGDLEIAIETVRAAKRAGADAIKLQTYTADTITLDCDNEDFIIKGGTLWDGKTLHSLYNEAFTPWEWHEELFRVAKEEGLVCFSSPFDFTAVDFLEQFDVPAL